VQLNVYQTAFNCSLQMPLPEVAVKHLRKERQNVKSDEGLSSC